MEASNGQHTPATRRLIQRLEEAVEIQKHTLIAQGFTYLDDPKYFENLIGAAGALDSNLKLSSLNCTKLLEQDLTCVYFNAKRIGATEVQDFVSVIEKMMMKNNKSRRVKKLVKALVKEIQKLKVKLGPYFETLKQYKWLAPK